MHRMHATHHEQTEVHQVAVAPAAVALELVEQVRRQFLVAARQVIGDPHAPAGTAHQRGFDEVVGEDRPGERAGAGQRRQRAVLDERLHANDRVVAPVMRFTQLPEVEPGGKQRTVDARGELLQPRIERVHARRLGRSLDDAGVGVGLHQSHQAGQAFAAHHAVGVQHHHVAVAAAPATAEVVDVAALALHAAPAAAVEDVTEAIHRTAQLDPGLLLGNTGVGVVAVAEHEDIEVLDLARGQQRLVGRPQPGEHPRYVLVGDGHHQRRTRLGRNRFAARAGGGNVVAITPLEQLEEAHQRRPETHRDPAEQQREQQQNAGLHQVGQDLPRRLLQRLEIDLLQIHQRPALIRQHGLHVPGGDGGLHQHQAQQRSAPVRGDPAPARPVERVRRVGLLHRTVLLEQQAPPAQAQYAGMPGFRHHPRAHDRWRRLDAGAALVILGQHSATLEKVTPGQSQPRRDRTERIARRRCSFGCTLRQCPMDIGQFAPLLLHLLAQRLALASIEGKLGEIMLGGRSLRVFSHGRVSDSSRFRTAWSRHPPAQRAIPPGAPGP